MRTMNRTDKSSLLGHCKFGAEMFHQMDRARISGIILALYWSNIIDWQTRETALVMTSENQDIREYLEQEIRTDPEPGLTNIRSL